MPRAKRNQGDGYFHVLVKGNNGQNIFNDDEDRITFCRLFTKGIQRTGCSLHSYCLMDNHVHLLMRRGDKTISQAIHFTAPIYAKYFNAKYDRKNHLFRNRFRNVAICDDIYLKRVVRYIHLNPVRAAMTAHPLSYRWSSYRNFLDGETELICDCDPILKCFGEDKKSALDNYCEYLDAKMSTRDLIEIRHLIKTGKSQQFFTLEELGVEVCSLLNLSLEQIRGGNRNEMLQNARSFICYMAKMQGHFRRKEISKFICCSETNVSRMIHEIKKKIINDKSVSNLIYSISDNLKVK